MKKIILFIFIICLSSCNIVDIIKVNITYDGTFIVTITRASYVYITSGTFSKTFDDEKLRSVLGGEINDMELTATKFILEPDIDMGDLIVELYENDKLIDQDIAHEGTKSAKIKY